MKKTPFRSILLLLPLLLIIGLVAARIEISLPVTPNLRNTLTPETQPTTQEIGSYDLLGRVISRDAAIDLRQTEAGRLQLAPENGAVQITQKLIDRGRKAFYEETFGGEVFQTEVTGALDGVLNVVNISQAILKLHGEATTNLQVPLNQDVTIGGRTFTKGTLLNTGLDVPAFSLTPLGMKISARPGKVKAGITCALCHASVDRATGRVIEGAPNNDVNMGLLLASATNSAALFRQTGVNPTKLPPGNHTYINSQGQEARLPDAKLVEDAVDAQLLTWLPGNFDSTGNMVNNPSQNPASYTFENYPYGWSGFSAIGWFHGLTTLNNNVHATNSDATTGADSSEKLLGIDKETYLGVILQNSSNPRFRLPQGAKPSEFFESIDPTPGEPGMNEVIRMPGYPQGSRFMLDGLMANSPGTQIGQELNGMSAWQNTLAPPAIAQSDPEILQRGAQVFDKAGCTSCHVGRYFTNHQVISEREIKSQPSRAKALAPFTRIFADPPRTFPPSESVPPSKDAPILTVPTDITPQKSQQLAYAQKDPFGGYKVPSLIGLAVTAPYLHDGGVAATAEAIAPDDRGRYQVVDESQIGAAGTSLKFISPDPAASLRVLVDRNLRNKAIAANRANRDLRLSNVDGSGHNYWVDRRSGYSTEDQTALIEFMLSLDDDPIVLTAESAAR
ncbi:hypothetical protein H6F67_12610 [Microcoleus sp. FACHB-1515]|uniref:hypothetical protein n=1 Tax=Cyanophyceae TaxID=3028117 RepID=UPI0016873F01|nr:hypothetical protein [Microcoleus sp. FACHB-1515]MBD2090696.1 hypothetical protein [Microcoleus sp. FACHB-1515]